MGMFSSFVAGAAGTGATLLSQEALDDAKTNADLLKAQRVMDMQATQNEKLRVAGADRVKEYFAPTTENVAGAATAVDDDNNPTSPNDYTKSRAATLGEAASRAGVAGDMDAYVKIHGMGYQDDRLGNALERIKTMSDDNRYRTDSNKAIADAKDETRQAMYLDADGNPVQKGKVSDFTNSALMNARHEADGYLRQATEFDKELIRERSEARKIAGNLMLSKDEKAKATADQNSILADIQKSRDDARDKATQALMKGQDILSSVTKASAAVGNSNPGGGVTPSFAKALAERGSPADLANNSPAGKKFTSAREAASSLDGKAKNVLPVMPAAGLAPLAGSGMMLSTDNIEDAAYNGRL